VSLDRERVQLVERVLVELPRGTVQILIGKKEKERKKREGEKKRKKKRKEKKE